MRLPRVTAWALTWRPRSTRWVSAARLPQRRRVLLAQVNLEDSSDETEGLAHKRISCPKPLVSQQHPPAMTAQQAKPVSQSASALHPAMTLTPTRPTGTTRTGTDPKERLPRGEAAGDGHRHQVCRRGCSNRRGPGRARRPRLQRHSVQLSAQKQGGSVHAGEASRNGEPVVSAE